MRQTLELRAGIEPALSPWHSDVIPLDQRSIPDTDGATRRRGDIYPVAPSPRHPVSVSLFPGAGERIRTFIKLGLSQSPLPIGLRQHATNFESRISNCELIPQFAIRNPQSSSALGEIRTHHYPVSKTGDSYQLVYEGITHKLQFKEEAVRLELTTALPLHGFKPCSSSSQITSKR